MAMERSRDELTAYITTKKMPSPKLYKKKLKF